MTHTYPNHCRKSAFTLLEVIIALSILAGAIAVLGEVMSIAGRNAADAQAEAQAQLLASSVMDEMLSGIAELTEQTRQPLETNSAIPWVYSVTVDNTIITGTSVTGLILVEVLVEQEVEKQFRPVKFRLARWLSTESGSATVDEESENDSVLTTAAEADSNA